MPVDPSAIIQTSNLLLSITDKLMDKMPNYTQRKREKYYKLRKAYKTELNADIPYRDDERLDELWEELLLFIAVFNKEIATNEN